MTVNLSAADQMIGEELRGYRILAPLGQGGFGRTFLVRAEANATEAEAGHKYVLKEFCPNMTDPESRQIAQDRFLREAAVLLDMGQKHDQIPRLLSYFRHQDGFYLVQEYIAGETLTQRVERQGPLSSATVAQILQQVLPILSFLHNQKIIHRDVKPDNIILRAADGKPVLIDFGAVKESVNTVITTGHGKAVSVIVGSPGFMPPEQATGRPTYVSDLYSLGLTAIYLLTGKAPQDLNTHYYSQELIWQAAVTDLDPALAEVLEKAICFNPRDRYDTAQVMLDAINQLKFDSEPGQLNGHIHTPTVADPDVVPLASPTAPTQLFSADQAGIVPTVKRIISPRHRPKLRWRLRLAIFSLLAAGLGATLYSLQVIKQQQVILANVQELRQQGRYPECVAKLASLGAVNTLPPDLQNLKSDCHLAWAEQEAQAGHLGAAIAQTNQVANNATIYPAASRLQDKWAKQLLDAAKQDYLQGRLQVAVDLANSIPESSSHRVIAQASIQTWQLEWERNQKHIRAAQTALQVGDWQEAQVRASEVTTPYWLRQAEPLLLRASRLAEQPPQSSPVPVLP